MLTGDGGRQRVQIAPCALDTSVERCDRGVRTVRHAGDGGGVGKSVGV